MALTPLTYCKHGRQTLQDAGNDLNRHVAASVGSDTTNVAETLWLATLVVLALLLVTPSAFGQGVATAFNETAVGSQSSVQSVSVSLPQGGVVSSIAVVTVGAPALDYVEAAGGSCSAGNDYGASSACTVMVKFTPHSPGLRPGAVVLRDSAGRTIGIKYLSGMGQGGLGVFIPGMATTVAGDGDWTSLKDEGPAAEADLDLPSGVAIDGMGNLFIADSVHHRIRRVDAITQVITTIAGNGSPDFSGDEGRR